MTIVAERMTAQVDGDFVVFLIGMRINHWHKPWTWLPVARAMPRMLAELQREPGLGLLHAGSHFSGRSLFTIQYWRSFDHLHAYAHAPAREHRPAWTAFNRAIGSGGDVGIWHETYLVAAGQYETVYNNMPRVRARPAGASCRRMATGSSPGGGCGQTTSARTEPQSASALYTSVRSSRRTG